MCESSRKKLISVTKLLYQRRVKHLCLFTQHCTAFTPDCINGASLKLKLPVSSHVPQHALGTALFRSPRSNIGQWFDARTSCWIVRTMLDLGERNRTNPSASRGPKQPLFFLWRGFARSDKNTKPLYFSSLQGGSE